MLESKPSRLRLAAFGEWIMVLPATIFLAAAALRLLQPREYEPARASWMIFEWTEAHVSRFDAAILFLVLPAAAAILGLALLLRAWRSNEDLRDDVTAAVAILQRYLSFFLLTAATALAAALFLFAASHVLTD